jgi:flavin reductase (DIM6/NTAB) family NADH-FMN oxidoreductase RutF
MVAWRCPFGRLRALLHGREEAGAGACAPVTGMTQATEFRRLMGNWATGVTVVTSQGPRGPHGMTANAFLSVSLEPPLVLVSVGHGNDSHAIIRSSKRFAVSILSEDQRELSLRFATRRQDSERAFDGIATVLSPGGLPWIAGALGCLECELQDEIEAQDQTLFLGRVTALQEGLGERPLVYFRSAYKALRDA